MRHAVILAGGSGTRLWPMSRMETPKQLIPFLSGKSLLQIAADRLQGLIPDRNKYVCASDRYRETMLKALPFLSPDQFIGEPTGRDTLNAVAYSCMLIASRDPEAVVAVVTADHLIEPVELFQERVRLGYELAEGNPDMLLAFGIKPSAPSTGYGYLQLEEVMERECRRVSQFQEKPDIATAKQFLSAGPERYLWNSGMYVWRASALLDCLHRYERATFDKLQVVINAEKETDRERKLHEVYPSLRKISVDYAIMEPASKDPGVRVVAIPMELEWMDVGSWITFAKASHPDELGNSISADRTVLKNVKDTLIASNDPNHLIAAVGCEELIIIHTPDATLVCKADCAEEIKDIHRLVGEKFGDSYL